MEDVREVAVPTECGGSGLTVPKYVVSPNEYRPLVLEWIQLHDTNLDEFYQYHMFEPGQISASGVGAIVGFRDVAL